LLYIKIMEPLCDITLHLTGYTNTNVVKCIYDKSPLEFYSRNKDDTVLHNQLNILGMAWPKINKEIFLKHVCSSSLEKKVWLNKLELVQDHAIKIKLSSINFIDLKEILKRSTFKIFENLENIKAYILGLKYPNIEIDWMFLILKHCNIEMLGLKKNTLYYVQEEPIITFKYS